MKRHFHRLDVRQDRGDVLLVAKLDRAFRNVKDCADAMGRWHERGLRVIFCTPDIDTRSAFGELMIGIFASVAQFESALKSEQQREIKALRKAQGFKIAGGCGPGFMVDPNNKRKLVADNEARRAIRRIVELRNSGLKWRAVSDQLEQELAEKEGRPVMPPMTFHKRRPGRRWTWGRRAPAGRSADRPYSEPDWPPADQTSRNPEPRQRVTAERIELKPNGQVRRAGVS